MSKYQYNGDEVREFPTLGLTVNPGETFEAPSDFDAAHVTPAGSKSAPTAPAVTPTPTASAPSDSTVGA